MYYGVSNMTKKKQQIKNKNSLSEKKETENVKCDLLLKDRKSFIIKNLRMVD